MKLTFALPLLASLAACDGLDVDFVGAQPEFVASSPTRATSTADWAGQRLAVFNARGNIEVIGVPGATRIEVEAYPVALADNQADADAAMADVAAQIVVTETPDAIDVTCPHARTHHGSALTGGTGCARLVLRVPVGSEERPARLDAHATFGGLRVEGLVGSAIVSATCDLHVAVTPTKDGNISIVNGNDGTNRTCPVVLVLPPEFTTHGLHVVSFSGEGSVVSDYPDLAVESCGPPTGVLQTIYPGTGSYPCISKAASHQGGASAAAQIEVLAGIGDAYLVSSPANAPAWTSGRCDRG